MSRLLQVAQLGQPVLRETAREVERDELPVLQDLIDDMLATVGDLNGAGLAAPQVNRSLRVFVLACRPSVRYPQAPFMEPVALINPVILASSDEIVKDWEGCLSIPGIRGLVPRASAITARFLDRQGRYQEARYVDFVARVFQHELDHLDGTVFLDRLESPKDLVTEKEFLRLVGNP